MKKGAVPIKPLNGKSLNDVPMRSKVNKSSLTLRLLPEAAPDEIQSQQVKSDPEAALRLLQGSIVLVHTGGGVLQNPAFQQFIQAL